MTNKIKDLPKVFDYWVSYDYMGLMVEMLKIIFAIIFFIMFLMGIIYFIAVIIFWLEYTDRDEDDKQQFKKDYDFEYWFLNNYYTFISAILFIGIGYILVEWARNNYLPYNMLFFMESNLYAGILIFYGLTLLIIRIYWKILKSLGNGITSLTEIWMKTDNSPVCSKCHFSNCHENKFCSECGEKMN